MSAYDSLNHLQKPDNPNAFWELAVPNGTYQVRVVSGDPANFDSVYRLLVEGTLAINATPTSTTRWFEATATVLVTDGRLTVSNSPGGQLTTRSTSSTCGEFDQALHASFLPGGGADGSALSMSSRLFRQAGSGIPVASLALPPGDRTGTCYECDFPVWPQFALLNCSEPPLGIVSVFHFSPAWIRATWTIWPTW